MTCNKRVLKACINLNDEVRKKMCALLEQIYCSQLNSLLGKDNINKINLVNRYSGKLHT